MHNLFELVDGMNHVHQNINYVQNKDDKKIEYLKEDIVHLIKHIELEYDVE